MSSKYLCSFPVYISCIVVKLLSNALFTVTVLLYIALQLQYGYRISVWRCILFYPLAILPACIGLLLAYWYPYWWIRLTCCKCDLDAAQFVTVQVSEGGGIVGNQLFCFARISI